MVVTQLTSDTNDFSRSIIVFPGKRPAHFVRKAIADQLQGSFIPPHIFSIDSFIEYLVTKKLQVCRRALEGLDAVALLFDIHTTLPNHLGGDHFNSVDRFVGLGLRIFAEMEELVMADVTIDHIREALSSVPLGRVQALPQYFERFYFLVEERGFTTRSLNYRRVADNLDAVDLSSYASIILAGFYAYTALERRIIRSLLRRDNTIFMAQQGPGLQKQLASIGVETKAKELSVADRSPKCYLYKASDTHGQVFAVSQKVKAMIETGDTINERTVIVLPTSDALFPVLHHTLPLLPRDGYNIALGYPLERTPLFGFLNSLIKVSAGALNGKVSVSDYTTYVLHPYTKNILFGQRADVTRVLFHAIETHLARNQSKMFVALESLEEDSKLLDNVRRGLAASDIEVTISELKNHLKTVHDQTIRKFLGFQSLQDFAVKAIEVLQYIHKQSTATRHALFRPYAERCIELLNTISESLLAGHRFAEPADYFTFLQNAMATEEVPFRGTPLKGLQVLGLLETRNLSFDTVFFLNATDDVIPGGRGHDVLLPQRLRETLHLETHRDREKLVEYYFSTLLAGAREVHCFFTESGNHEKSRFLEKLLWEQQKSKKDLDVKDLVRVVRYSVRLSTSRPEAIQKTPTVVEHLKKFEHTATSLDTYLRCPLQFYYAHVLRLSEKEEVAEDIDQRQIGSFVHKVLKIYFDGLVERVLAPGVLDRARLRQVIDGLFTEEYGSDPIGPAYLVKQQATRQLDAFLTGYQIPMMNRGPIELLALEQELSAIVNGYCFSGRIDRIERRGNYYAILDYKTGRDDKSVRINLGKLDAGDSSTWRDAIGSFQLPVYMLLYSQSTGVPVDAITPAYLFLGRNEITTDIEIDIGGNKHTAAEVYHAVQPIMFRLVDEILNPDVPFEATDHFDKACPQCPYSTICGTAWVGGLQK